MRRSINEILPADWSSNVLNSGEFVVREFAFRGGTVFILSLLGSAVAMGLGWLLLAVVLIQVVRDFTG